MEFIYVENYLTISRDEKREFLVLLGSFTNFRVTNQKIVLNDNSLILEFAKNSDIGFAKEAIEKFFEVNSQVNIKIVSCIEQSNHEIILTFEDKKQKKVKL